jgi:hypothetical protein
MDHKKDEGGKDMAQEHKDRDEVFICERCGPFDDDLTTYDFSITAQIRGDKVILVFECCGCGWATGQVEVKDFSLQSEYITTRPAVGILAEEYIRYGGFR